MNKKQYIDKIQTINKFSDEYLLKYLNGEISLELWQVDYLRRVGNESSGAHNKVQCTPSRDQLDDMISQWEFTLTRTGLYKRDNENV